MLSNILTAIEEKDVAGTVQEPAKVIEPALKPVPPKIGRHRSRYWVAAAAGISFLLFMYHQHTNRTVIRTTGYGETARIILPDSSAVTLNGNSTVEYPASWEENDTRKIKLGGEAFFSVRHKGNNQKFVVETAGMIQIEVLGTEFNVSDRKYQTQVVLVSGKIRLAMQHPHQQNKSLVMKPGESVEILPNNTVLHKQRVDPAVATSWTGDKLLFDNTPVREICERLKDTYGYKINLSDQKVLDQRITGSVPNQNIDQVLAGLEAILDVKFTKTAE